MAYYSKPLVFQNNKSGSNTLMQTMNSIPSKTKEEKKKNLTKNSNTKSSLGCQKQPSSSYNIWVQHFFFLLKWEEWEEWEENYSKLLVSSLTMIVNTTYVPFFSWSCQSDYIVSTNEEVDASRCHVLLEVSAINFKNIVVFLSVQLNTAPRKKLMLSIKMEKYVNLFL